MTTTAGEADGSFSDQEITYLAARGHGGIGTIITPACYCHKSGHSFPGQVGAHSDAMLPSLTKCAEAINVSGAVSILQIHHGGNAAHEKYSGERPWAPSAVKNRRGTSELPTEMSIEQIGEIQAAFAAAAVRAKKAGFHGVELHGANTYLFQQFFSPFTNRRDDDYGVQNWENRCRFATETVRAVRDAVGPDYPVWYRVSPEEPDPDGYDTEDALELLQRLVGLGIDAVHVSSWEYGVALRPKLLPGGHPTKAIKLALGVPIVGVGGVRTPDQAAMVIEDGIDMVALGRVLLYDLRWAHKVRSGRIADLRLQVTEIEELEALEVPDKMKTYLKGFFPDNI